MNTKNIISGTITGTLFMTLFSDILSYAEKKNFKEPKLLGIMINRLLPVKKKTAEITGVMLHYTVGYLFVSLYSFLWNNTRLKPTLTTGGILGALSGIAAIAVWKTTFSLHPAPPHTDHTAFYNQLFAAHIIFAVFAVVGYNMVNEPEVREISK